MCSTVSARKYRAWFGSMGNKYVLASGSGELICSPDAKSAIKAYNILKKDPATISPTLYIGGERKTKTIGGWE